MDIIVSKISISFSIHATENLNTNMDLLSKITGKLKKNQYEIIRERLEGGYGNPIIFVQIFFTKSSAINKVLKTLKNKLPDSEKKLLYSEFDKRFDTENTSLFIRLDKENLCHDTFKITDLANAIKIIFKVRAFTKQADFKGYLVQEGILANLV